MTNTKNKPKPKKVTFKDYLNSELSLNARPDMIDQIIVGCGMSEPTFYRRLKHPEFFSPADRAFISKLAGKKYEIIF